MKAKSKSPKLKVEALTSALQGIESNHQLDKATIEEALKEALTKAYQKQAKLSVKSNDLRDVMVKVEIVNGIIHIYQQREVMNDDDIEDDELEISLEEARKIKPDAKIGDMIDEEVDFTTFDRAAVVLAKNVMKQKIREAEKQLVYEEYCDKVDEMVSGVVETVDEKRSDPDRNL